MLEYILAFALETNQPSLPTTADRFVFQHQKPPAYAQAASPSIDRLLAATQQAQCKTRTEDEVIKKYKKIIADNGPEKEEAISKLLDFYKSLADKAISKGYSKKCMNAIIDESFDFYNDVTINHTDSHNKAKALLYLGDSLGRIISPSNYDEAIEKLREAYGIGDQKIKAGAAWNLAFIYWNYSTGLVGTRESVQKYSLSDAEKQFRFVIEHAPNSENAKKAREILKNHFRKRNVD